MSENTSTERDKIILAMKLDVDETLKMLKPLLEYRKEVCKTLINISGERDKDDLLQVKVYTERNIEKLLGL